MQEDAALVVGDAECLIPAHRHAGGCSRRGGNPGFSGSLEGHAVSAGMKCADFDKFDDSGVSEARLHVSSLASFTSTYIRTSRSEVL